MGDGVADLLAHRGLHGASVLSDLSHHCLSLPPLIFFGLGLSSSSDVNMVSCALSCIPTILVAKICLIKSLYIDEMFS